MAFIISKLAADPKNNFTVFDTRNTLTRNAAQPNGWANEYIRYFTGFTALANRSFNKPAGCASV